MLKLLIKHQQVYVNNNEDDDNNNNNTVMSLLCYLITAWVVHTNIRINIRSKRISSGRSVRFIPCYGI